MVQFRVFLDLTIPQYNLDVSQLEEALSEKTKAVMIAHTLGNPFDLKAIRSFCDAHGLWLIEDNCDALGSEYCMDGVWRKTEASVISVRRVFYPPHHMTMGEGGAVYTDNPFCCIRLSVPCATGGGTVCVRPERTICVVIVLINSMGNFHWDMITSMYTLILAII